MKPMVSGCDAPALLLSLLCSRLHCVIGVDNKNKKIFAFIANDPKTKTMACHIFLCKVKGGDGANCMHAANVRVERCGY